MKKISVVLIVYIFAHVTGERSNELKTLISGHEEACTESDNVTDILPANHGERCKSCGGKTKTQYKKCGNRGLDDKSFCSYNYAGEWICLQNGYCKDHTAQCNTDSDCEHGQSCAYAACSHRTLCYDLCVKGLPTFQPTTSPTTLPMCSSCVGSTMYSQCGTRGLHDYSFCAKNVNDNPVCIQNMYCSDITRVCNSTEQCNPGDDCVLSGCTSNEYYCHRRCESALGIAPPSPAPTPATQLQSKRNDGDVNHLGPSSLILIIIISVLCLVILVIICILQKKKQGIPVAVAHVVQAPEEQIGGPINLIV